MFFETKDSIPEGLGISTFGIIHLIWLFSFAVICVAWAIIYAKLSTRQRNIAIKVLGWFIIFLEMSKNVVVVVLRDFDPGYLPFHLCGINILLICFDLFKQTKIVRNFLYYFCIPGALLALLFPNWTMLPCMNFFSINSFLIHGFLLMYPLLLVASGELTPSVKMMPKCIFLLVLMAVPIYFMNLAWDTNFMFLMSPETGNPLGLFEKYLGSHLWGFPILLPIVMFIMYIPIFIISKCKKKDSNKTETKEKQEITV